MGTVPPRVALARPLPDAAAALLAAIERGAAPPSRARSPRSRTARRRARPRRVPVADRVAESTARAHVVGITGPPGAGKSTLINALLGELLARGQRIAVVAVDPSSPLTGGAVLGDRIRMGEFGADDASSSARWPRAAILGGLSRTTGAWSTCSMWRASQR